MPFDFETTACRDGLDNLRNVVADPAVTAAGLMTYDCGELEFKTAPSVIDAVVKRAQNGLFGFTWPGDEYYERVKFFAKERRGWDIERAWVVPTHGTIFALASAIRLFTGEGDAIVVQPPVYNRYEQAARRTNRKTLEAPLVYKNGDYEMDFAALEKMLSDESAKLMVLCNPQNPTGNIWGVENLTRVVALCKAHGVVLFSDEIYSDNVSPGLYVPPILTIPGAEDIAILAWGLGKGFNFTGVNHAHVFIANAEMRERYIAQRDGDHYGSIDPFVHAAVLGAYTQEGLAWQREMTAYVTENANAVKAFFAQHMPQVHVCPGSGFLLWIDWQALNLNEEELMQFLIGEGLFQTDAGSHYGAPGFTRMSLGVPHSALGKSLETLLKAAKARGYAV